MQIPRSLLNEINREVSALSSAAQQQASMALDRVFLEWDGNDVSALRNAVIAVLEALMPTYTDLSAARAADFYDEVRHEQNASGVYSSVADSRWKSEATRAAIRGLIESVNKTHETEQFKTQTLQRVDAEVRRAANECLAYNASRDPAKPSYARVPVGETCGFCLMLASFGFTYTSEEAAHHSHANCNCRVVPSFGKAEVRGYDPGEVYTRYNDCSATLGGRDGIRAEWSALPKEERGKYIAKHGNKEGEAFEKFVNKRMAAEIETRDPEWFTTGKVSEPTYKKPRSALLEHEQAGVDWLCENGFKLETVEENPKAPANLDLKMNGRLWEMKNVTNVGSSVKNQMSRAKKKWAKLGNPGEAYVVMTMYGCSDSIEEVTEKVSSMGDYRQVLIVSNNGLLRIMK